MAKSLTASDVGNGEALFIANQTALYSAAAGVLPDTRTRNGKIIYKLLTYKRAGSASPVPPIASSPAAVAPLLVIFVVLILVGVLS